jgi:hypothetical protein
MKSGLPGNVESEVTLIPRRLNSAWSNNSATVPRYRFCLLRRELRGEAGKQLEKRGYGAVLTLEYALLKNCATAKIDNQPMCVTEQRSGDRQQRSGQLRAAALA